ncbi:MAG TPA: Na+/H+ antiporter, partial [Actinomycetota bacterium]|nr:Na+/H+ antiporter [Actinomycetota bacterium]
IGQGLTLPLVIRRLGVAAEDEGSAGDGRRAMARLSEVALDHLDALDPEADGVPAELVERLRERYRTRLAHLDQQGEEGQPDGTRAYDALVHDLLGAQREELRRLSARGRITPEGARRLDHDLDAEEARLERERPA